MKIIPEMNYTWESQAVQYPATGEPGITVETYALGTGEHASKVDCLLYRDDDGQLIGILNRYYENNPHQAPDTGNLWVKPDCHHNGVATALLRKAAELYPEKAQGWVDNQTFTHAGVAWIESLVRKGIINQERTAFIDEE